jgi:predicted alternative tryptophan synthase beta-subunit
VLFNLSGHGPLDLTFHESHLTGTMQA